MFREKDDLCSRIVFIIDEDLPGPVEDEPADKIVCVMTNEFVDPGSRVQIYSDS